MLSSRINLLVRPLVFGLFGLLISGFFLLPAAVSAQTAQEEINNSLCSGANLDFSGNSTDCQSGDANIRLNDLVHSIVNLLSAIVGVVAVIMIIVGGFRYITSGGNDTSVTGAKNTILYAIIGLIIVALAQLIVRFTLNKVATS